MNIIDCHTHTQFSMDSEADINECVKRACDLGLAAYAITDHCECNGWYEESHYTDSMINDHFNYAADYEASVSAVTKLKEQYDGRFDIICGTEMGQALLAPDIAEKIINDERLDFVLASIHMIKNEKDFYFIDYTKMSMDDIYDLLGRYFSEIYDLCRWGKFDILGHLTYCLRYMKQRHGICPDISRFDDVIEASLRTLAQNGKGIEINTSGIRQGFGATFPDLKYVKMFREAGGEVLSVGSDAHTVADIGANAADAAEIAKAAGFKYLCCFKKRKPEFIKIDG